MYIICIHTYNVYYMFIGTLLNIWARILMFCNLQKKYVNKCHKYMNLQ